MMKTPLAWLQLTHEKVRLLVALAGITFADVLMFTQLGFRDALYRSSARFHQNLEGDIVLIHPKSDTLVFTRNFSRRRLYQVLGIEEIETVTPIYLEFGIWKNPTKLNTRNILVIGFNPTQKIMNLPGLEKHNLDNLKLKDVILFDQLSRREFGDIAVNFNPEKPIFTEVSNQKIKIGGLFTLGTSFGADGNIITSDTNFFRIFPQKDPELISIGLIRLKPTANKKVILNLIKNKLSAEDVKVLTKEEFINHEKSYWQNRTAIGFIFMIGTAMGFIVGTVIVYQILYTGVADHLSEYATLKAIGYTHRYLLIVVFQQAIILACVGFIPGLGLSSFLYYYASFSTRLPLIMTVNKAMMVLLLTIIMCSVSGAIAVNKLKAADLADIF
jgi:putative ABC transport system permease protein